MKTAKTTVYHVIIDVFTSEEGNYVYRVCLNDGKPSLESGIPYMLETGFFTDTDELDNWLEENKKEIKVAKDYRFEV